MVSRNRNRFGGFLMKRAHIVAATATLLTFGGNLTVTWAQEALDEIIVTARKKAENLQEIPVSVTAIGEGLIEDLALQDLSDISKLTAGLIFDNEFGRTSDRPVIRGQANILGDSGVSYFIDGVYIDGPIADYDLNDVERIEIVKGPQSALYGRNTYSGAINIITRSPGDELSGNVQGEITDDGQYEISASVRGPLTDTLGGGVTARFFNNDGNFINQFDGADIGEQESTSVSGVLVFTPSEDLEIRGRAYYSELDDGQPALFHQAAADNQCFTDNGALYGGVGRYYCGVVQPGVINSDFPIQAPDARDEVETLNASLKIDYDINDEWSFTSITGYNKRNALTITEADYQPTSFQTANFTPGGFPFAGFPAPPFSYGYVGAIVDFTFSSYTKTDDVSQEFRFSYSGDTIQAILGAYYLDQSSDSRDVRALPPGAANIALGSYLAELGAQTALCDANFLCDTIVPFFGPGIVVPRDVNLLDTRNTALFGLLTYDLTENTSLTVEGRWQSEKIEQNTTIQDLGSPVESTSFAEETFTSFTPRITLDWQRTENHLLYVLAATGTKPGGFNSTVAIEAGLPTFEEEDVLAWEIGSKSSLADGQMNLNLAIFVSDIEGYQLTQNARSGANTTSATVNAGDADIFGVEIEIAARPNKVEGLGIVFNYALTDSEFSEGFDQREGLLLDAADNGLVDCSTGFQFPDAGTCTGNSLFGSIAGKQIPRTAKHQAYLDLELRRPFASGNGWEWFVGTNYSYESSKFSQVHNLAETGNTQLVNARFGFTNDRYSLNFWGRNLTGEESSPLVLRYADGADSFKQSFVGTARRDTYYGLTATARF